MEHCKNIDECPVVKAVDEKLDERLDVIADSYERTQEAIQESSQHLQAVNLVFAEQTVMLRGLGESLKEYKAENEKAHEAFKLVDQTVHSRITGTQLELEKVRGSINTKIAEKIGSVKVSVAEAKGSIKGKVDWKEVIKFGAIITIISIMVTAFSAFLKYFMLMIGG